MIQIFLTPLFLRLLKTPNQYLLLSFSPISILKTSFFPSSFIPKIIYAAFFLIIPLSLTEKWMASTKTTG